MGNTDSYDAIVVGAGPAGSVLARKLMDAGLRVAIVDRVAFPRVKLCAGWLSQSVWPALGLAPREYTGALWRWNTCHVHYRGAVYRVRAQGYFIRRYQFDQFLLQRSGATFVELEVKSLAQDANGHWLVNGGVLRAPLLIGAAGTHCPVSRHLFGKKRSRPVGARELEFPVDSSQLVRARAGRDGEPELMLHSDLRGYSWNVPKTDWLNIGTGTQDAKEVRKAWLHARECFTNAGHIPASSQASLDSMKGHSYYLFEPSHLLACQRQNVLLVGDSLGLAHPLTAEGILPAIVSANLAAESIASGKLSSYAQRLAAHPLFADYATLWRLRDTGGALRQLMASSSPSPRGSDPHNETNRPRAVAETLQNANRLFAVPQAAAHRAIAQGFARMFSGHPLPGRTVIDPLIRAVRRSDRFVSASTLANRQAPPTSCESV